MKRRIAGIIIMVILAGICLAGCSGGLTDADFNLYDKDGKIAKSLKEEGSIYAGEGEYTSRKIGIGSTSEETAKAYEDVLETANVLDNISEDGTHTKIYKWIVGENILQIIEENEEVTSVHTTTKEMDRSAEFSTMIDLLGRGNFDAANTAQGQYEIVGNALTDQEMEVLKVLYEHNILNASNEDWMNGEVFEMKTMAKGLDDLTFLTKEQKELAKSAYNKFKENYDFGY